MPTFDECKKAVPHQVGTALAANLAEHRGRVAAMMQEVDSLNRQFERAGIGYAVWKGFALTPEYCPDACLRPSYDYDYLISRDGWDGAKEVLQAAGYIHRPDSHAQFHLTFVPRQGPFHISNSAGGVLPDAALDSAQLFRAQPDGSLKILNVNLAAALNADPLENVIVQPRDRIVVHRSMYRVDPPSVYIRGEVANPGRYPLGENMRVADLLHLAGGPKRSSDLTHGDLTRYFRVSGTSPGSAHQRIDPAAIFHDTTQNFSLRDGDVLSVPELSGWKDLGASITVKGEVRNPGEYGIHPGERLSSVLSRAGGLLPTACPQGAIFVRPSVRELQEKSRQELIQRMEQESATVKTSLSTTGSEQAQLAQEAAQQQQRVLEALRRAPASGRLVIQMHQGLKGFENSPQDIEVRDGDALEIPKQPGVVLVVGQVYNTNAITYVAGKNAAWYLSQGGGATRLADKGAIFIVRANGEITSHHQGGWWSHDTLSAAVRPGDTIVVPERPIIGDSRWKNPVAIGQIAEAAAVIP